MAQQLALRMRCTAPHAPHAPQLAGPRSRCVAAAARPRMRSAAAAARLTRCSSHAAASGSHAPAVSVAPRAAQQPRAQPAYVAHLLVSCPDQKGVVAALAQLLYGYGVNILTSDQFSDIPEAMYFQRLTFDYTDLIVGPENVNVLENAMANTAARFNMTWSIHYPAKCVERNRSRHPGFARAFAVA